MLRGLRFRYARWRAVRDASRGLPAPTASERALIDELRRGCAALPVEPTEGRTPNAADWATAMNRLQALVRSADPRAFLRWDVIIARMAPRHSPVTPLALAELQARVDWDVRWKGALRECDAGRPHRYAEYPDSSEPLIQTAHVLAQMESLAGRPITSWETIYEFGGGFGNLCRLAHHLGFRGRYVILDLAPFTLLQRYYLRSAGVIEEGDDDRVVLTSDVSVLERLLDGKAESERALFVAWWSLSETPLAQRERIRPLVQRIGDYWIAYQERYGEVDNVNYFGHAWLDGPRRACRDPHRASDHFLAGGRIEDGVAPGDARDACASSLRASARRW